MSAGELIVLLGPPAVGKMTVGRAGERDAAYIRGLLAPNADRGLQVRFVELYAEFATRLDRNAGADRLAAKPSKRDLAWSAAHIREREAAFTMNTAEQAALPGEDLLADLSHLRIDTTDLDPGQAAARILAQPIGGPTSRSRTIGAGV